MVGSTKCTYNAIWWPLKVGFSTNWKHVRDLLLVILSNLHPFLHKFVDTVTWRLKITNFPTPLTLNALTWVNPFEFLAEPYTAKTTVLRPSIGDFIILAYVTDRQTDWQTERHADDRYNSALDSKLSCRTVRNHKHKRTTFKAVCSAVWVLGFVHQLDTVFSCSNRAIYTVYLKNWIA